MLSIEDVRNYRENLLKVVVELEKLLKADVAQEDQKFLETLLLSTRRTVVTCDLRVFELEHKE